MVMSHARDGIFDMMLGKLARESSIDELAVRCSSIASLLVGSFDGYVPESNQRPTTRLMPVGCGRNPSCS